MSQTELRHRKSEREREKCWGNWSTGNINLHNTLASETVSMLDFFSAVLMHGRKEALPLEIRNAQFMISKAKYFLISHLIFFSFWYSKI